MLRATFLCQLLLNVIPKKKKTNPHARKSILCNIVARRDVADFWQLQAVRHSSYKSILAHYLCDRSQTTGRKQYDRMDDN